jgi:hypothetical protein
MRVIGEEPMDRHSLLQNVEVIVNMEALRRTGGKR